VRERGGLPGGRPGAWPRRLAGAELAGRARRGRGVRRPPGPLSPRRRGGRGASAIDQLIFTDEAAVAGVPVPFLTLHTVGPTIMRFGTAEQKARYLPRIAAGESHLSICH